MGRAERTEVLLRPSHWPGVQLVEADTARSFGRHTHDEFGIGLVTRGAQKSASGRGGVEAMPGDVITVNPGEVHDGKPLDSTGRRWLMVYLDPSHLAHAAQDLLPGTTFEFEAPVWRDARLAAHLQALIEAVSDTDGLRFESSLLTLVAGRLAPASAAPLSHDGLRRAQERIDDDPGQPHSLAILAAEAGLSRHHFLRSFARLTGLPPHAYLLQRRALRARQLLRQGLTPVEAAAASGFADQSHLNRTLVRHYGLTPGAIARSATAISFKTR